MPGWFLVEGSEVDWCGGVHVLFNVRGVGGILQWLIVNNWYDCLKMTDIERDCARARDFLSGDISHGDVLSLHLLVTCHSTRPTRIRSLAVPPIF